MPVNTMSHVLFIKTSSLGDVIHHMPAVTEARRYRPDATFAWVVEETFAPLVRLHPAVDEVIPVAWRRWRKSLWSPATIHEIAGSLRSLGGGRYDEVIDTQGLLRSAFIARFVRGHRHGYESRSVREPAASLFYDVRHRVSRDLHAIERNRTLTGLALGYTPTGTSDFGFDRTHFKASQQRYAVLLHATARPEKEWSVENWIAVATVLAQAGLEPILPWGTQAEQLRSKHIADSVPGAGIPERMPLDKVAELIAGAQFVVGVDTGLLHLAAALGVPVVAIFTGSEPRLTAPIGRGPIIVLGAPGKFPLVEEVKGAIAKVTV
jgi:heptosyltransferase I